MAGKNPTGWRPRKPSRERYLQRGEPLDLEEDDLSSLPGWEPPTEEEMQTYWAGLKELVEKRKTKREVMVTVTQHPPKAGKFMMKIEVLHLEYQGFAFTCSDADQNALNQKFWPIVMQLWAHFFSPRIVGRPGTPLRF